MQQRIIVVFQTLCNPVINLQANFLFHAIIVAYICVKLRISHKCHKTPAICNVSIFLDNCGLGKIIIRVAKPARIFPQRDSPIRSNELLNQKYRVFQYLLEIIGTTFLRNWSYICNKFKKGSAKDQITQQKAS